jgi:Mor family transcriptional regulator
VKYRKAEMILPDDLVKEIQKYIQGEYIYVPTQAEKRKRWGENSGSRMYIRNRNDEIRNKHRDGYKIQDLAKEFFLSLESIRKIIYSNNK